MTDGPCDRLRAANTMSEPLDPPETREEDRLHRQWDRVREHVVDLSERYDRSEPPEIIAVTKGFPASLCRRAVRAGFDRLGENRVSEGLSKREELSDLSVNWHMVGHLQSNKVRKLNGAFSLIHSLDRSSLLEEFRKRLSRDDREQDVLLQVNVSGEESKHGADPEEAHSLLNAVSDVPELHVRGLMTMAPRTEDRDRLNRTFERCRQLRDRLEERTDWELPELSMGMTNDYPQAIRQGATMVRLGRVLFGERPDG